MTQKTAPMYFNRYLASLAVQGKPEFIDFLTQVRPQVLQMGFYGPQIYALGEAPEEGKQWAGGYPMQMPVRGIRQVLEWQRDFNCKAHELGIKVVGHFSMTVAWGEPEEQTGVFDFFAHHWPEDLLGEKPVERVEDLMQKNPDGSIHMGDRWGFPRTAGCSNNPHWRELHKRMVRIAIEMCDIDGFMSWYNYDYGCACQYCNAAFRAYLAARYDPAALKAELAIDELASFCLDGTLARVTGWVDPDSPHPVALQIESMRFAQIAWKRHFDEIFIHTGRQLKPDLILGAWNHLGFMGMGQDERNVVPRELWGPGEDLFWYSTGGEFGSVAAGDAGVHTLNARWIWELCDHKLPVLGRYESTRVRTCIAESWANGGPGMGLYCGWEDPIGRQAYADYFDFARTYEDYFHPVASAAEVALVFPRQVVHLGDDGPVESFRQLGAGLLDAHVLFDVLSDENITPQRLSQYAAIILPDAKALSDAQGELLTSWVRRGGLLVAVGECATLDLQGRSRGAGLAAAMGLGESTGLQALEAGFVRTLPRADRRTVVETLWGDADGKLSRIGGPWMVRTSAFVQPGRILLHLVNYNRDESAEGSPSQERPLRVDNISVDLCLPCEAKVEAVDFISPDEEISEGWDGSSLSLDFRQSGTRVGFRIPQLLVYGVAAVHFESPTDSPSP